MGRGAEGMEWNHLAQYRDKMKETGNMVTNLPISIKSDENVVTKEGPCSIQLQRIPASPAHRGQWDRPVNKCIEAIHRQTAPEVHYRVKSSVGFM